MICHIVCTLIDSIRYYYWAVRQSEIDEIEQAWQEGCSFIIPEKSKYRYENTYRIFKKWCQDKRVDNNEKCLLPYFVQRNVQLKAHDSLWAEYSMIKSTTFLYDGIDISKVSTLIAYLKWKNVGYRPKKAGSFTREDMLKFLTEAPDEEFLIYKVEVRWVLWNNNFYFSRKSGTNRKYYI